MKLLKINTGGQPLHGIFYQHRDNYLRKEGGTRKGRMVCIGP